MHYSTTLLLYCVLYSSTSKILPPFRLALAVPVSISVRIQRLQLMPLPPSVNQFQEFLRRSRQGTIAVAPIVIKPVTNQCNCNKFSMKANVYVYAWAERKKHACESQEKIGTRARAL